MQLHTASGAAIRAEHRARTPPVGWFVRVPASLLWYNSARWPHLLVQRLCFVVPPPQAVELSQVVAGGCGVGVLGSKPLTSHLHRLRRAQGCVQGQPTDNKWRLEAASGSLESHMACTVVLQRVTPS
jgi:hypothetical protein